MSLVAQIDSLAERVGEEFNTVRTELASLQIGGGGTQQIFVQANAPVVANGIPYFWFQTGLGDGSGMTLWIDDGA